jgi:hypothetical protein
MKRIEWAPCFLVFVALAVRAFAQNDASSGGKPEFKRLITTLPEGAGGLRFTAISIDRDWNPPVTHLKGHVQVEIMTSPRNAQHVTILRADEADYYEKTGEIVPRGNVRITVQAVR